MTDQPQHVANLDEIEDGGMREVAFAGGKALLVRRGQSVSAVGATCPHAGAPLCEGILHGDRIVCPWHKAVFCIRSGALLDPPSVDPIERFDVHLDGFAIFLSKQKPPPEAAKPPTDTRCFVIVGAGGAGAVAAQTLRESGFNGRLVMLDRENRVPYDRTVLSKYWLSGEQGGEKSPLQSQAYYRTRKIERLTGTVVRVDPAERRIECADGTVLTYDAALLATGAAPGRPKVSGADLENVFLLRSRSDAESILERAERSTRAVVLGASFIGMEVAASLRERGLDVTVVGQERTPFEKQLGARIGAAFVSLHESRGVSFRLGRGVASIDGPGGSVREVVLDSGERLPADLVVIGFGVAPMTGYVVGLNRRDDGGLVVDARLQAAPGLYAAGDIAAFPYLGDGPPIRVEHWRVALQHGRVAALNMMGRITQYDAVPVFWTIQYLKRLDYIGHATDWDDIVVHGDLLKPDFIAYYVRNGQVVAAAGMDRDRDTAALIELFKIRRNWTAEELGDKPASTLARIRPR